MARRKPVVEENLDSGLFEAGEVEQLDEVLSGLPSDDVKISLWRINPQGAPSFITEFQPDDFSLEGVKNTYGGGRYKYVAKGQGIFRQGTFQIDGEPVTGPSKPVYKRYINGKLVFSKPNEADVIVSETAKGLNQGTDTNVMMLLLGELRSLRESMQHQGGKTQKDFLEELMLYKNLFQPVQNPIQDFPKIAMDLIKQGMDVAGAAENGGSPWMLILDKVMPIVQDVLKVVQAQQANPIPVNGHVMPNQAQRPIEQPKPENLTGFAAVAQDLQVYLPTFIRAAAFGTDPNTLVDLTLQSLPEGQISTVISWLESQGWFTDLSTLHPAIQAQAAWWSEYRNLLLEALKNPEPEQFQNAGE